SRYKGPLSEAAAVNSKGVLRRRRRVQTAASRNHSEGARNSRRRPQPGRGHATRPSTWLELRALLPCLANRVATPRRAACRGGFHGSPQSRMVNTYCRHTYLITGHTGEL